MHENIQTKKENYSDPIISFEDFDNILNKYPPESYSKLASMLHLRRIGLPTLSGFVVDKLNTETIAFLSNWAQTTQSKRLSLRFDSPIAQDNVKLSSLINPPVIGLVLAENDRYQQGHSVLTQFLEDRMQCDIVGPGFDAGDITRGKVTPHETIEIVHKSCSDFNSELSPLDVLSHQIVDLEGYRQSRKLRYGGIYSTINSALGKSVSSRDLNIQEVAQVDEFLNKRDAFIPDHYQPLGWEKLIKIYTHLWVLDTFRKYYKDNFGIDVKGRVLSSSFLKKYGLVFWDLYGGKKYSLGKRK